MSPGSSAATATRLSSPFFSFSLSLKQVSERASELVKEWDTPVSSAGGPPPDPDTRRTRATADAELLYSYIGPFYLTYIIRVYSAPTCSSSSSATTCVWASSFLEMFVRMPILVAVRMELYWLMARFCICVYSIYTHVSADACRWGRKKVAYGSGKWMKLLVCVCLFWNLGYFWKTACVRVCVILAGL